VITPPTNPTLRDLRWFGGLGLLFCWGLAAWLYASTHGSAAGLTASALAAAGLLLGASALVRPAILRPVYIGWMWIVFPIGWTLGHVLLGIVYFGVLTPVAWGMRLMKHDPLQRRVGTDSRSFWHIRSRQRTPSDYFRQF
jgi:hypothetical protein